MPASVLTRRHKGTETATVKAILSYLHLRGVLAFRMNSRVVMLPGKGGKETPYRMGGVKGMSDIVGVVAKDIIGPSRCPMSGCLNHANPYFPRGRFLAIEVKSAEGKPTPEQTAFLAAVVRAGGIGFIAKSVRDVQDHGL